jgi:hypothetical protein
MSLAFFMSLLSGSSPVTALDKTDFLFFGRANNPDTTGSLFVDESPNGLHMVSPSFGVPYGIATDINGKRVLRPPNASLNPRMAFDFGSVGPGSYSCYAVVRIADPNGYYFFDNVGHSLLLGINSYDGAYLANGVHGYLPVPVGELVCLVWVLDAASGTGKVYVNNEVVYSGAYYGATLTNGFLGNDYFNNYKPFQGDLHSFGIAAVAHLDTRRLEVSNFLLTEAGG